MRRLSIFSVLAAFAGLLAACGSNEPDFVPRTTPAGGSSPTATLPTTPTPTTPPTEFRVAFVNLMHGRPLDVSNTVPDATLKERLAMIIEELKAFNPDVVGLNEASITKAHGNIAAHIAKELKMEFQYRLSTPWLQTQTYADAQKVATQTDFEEGEAVLVSARYKLLRWDFRALNPRTSNTESRTALWVRMEGPEQVGMIDVYIAHLTAGTDKERATQATDLLKFVKDTRGTGAIFVLGDFSEPPGSETQKALLDGGLTDVLATLKEPLPLGTCCRDNVLGEQAPLTLRTDYIFSGAWLATSGVVLGAKPGKRPDGTLLYASDHNGVGAVFSLAKTRGE